MTPEQFASPLADLLAWINTARRARLVCAFMRGIDDEAAMDENYRRAERMEGECRRRIEQLVGPLEDSGVDTTELLRPTVAFTGDPDRDRYWLAAQVLLQRVMARLPRPPVPRLAVSIARRTITLDGIDYDVNSLQAVRWVAVLADHAGEWIASGELVRHDPELEGARTDRLRSLLPDAVQKMIESRPSAGSRLCLA